MENTNRDTAHNAAPQNDWRADETNVWLTPNNELANPEDSRHSSADERLYAAQNTNDPDPDDDDEKEEEEEEEAGDWGHVDPAESNGPFPDPNEPGFPGSAV